MSETNKIRRIKRKDIKPDAKKQYLTEQDLRNAVSIALNFARQFGYEKASFEWGKRKEDVV